MRAIVFVGGELGNVVANDLPAANLVVAADSGLHHARALEQRVDMLIGDMDSVDATLIGDTPQLRHPIDKDATDTELAIDYAVTQGATDVVVIGGLNGRLDHWLGIIFGLARPQWAGIELSAVMGRSRVYVMRNTLELEGEPGQIISQFAINGDVRGLTIEGLEWSGHYETVESGSSLCLSDRFVDTRCRLSVEAGVLLVVHELGPRH